jgi:2-haloacid dehalogenase
MQPHACIFDAYGTLFDLHSIAPGLPELSELWRRKQLEHTWLLALMERYKDFREVTETALRSSLRQLHIGATDERIQEFMRAYLSPAAFPEVRPALQNLAGTPLAILSNGTAGMVEAAVANSGLAAFFTHIISVDRVRTYKPSPRVYALGPQILGIPSAEILFVSSNSWDAAGAKAFGYQVCWCNRSGAPADDIGFAPDLVVSALDQIALDQIRR